MSNGMHVIKPSATLFESDLFLNKSGNRQGITKSIKHYRFRKLKKQLIDKEFMLRIDQHTEKQKVYEYPCRGQWSIMKRAPDGTLQPYSENVTGLTWATATQLCARDFLEAIPNRRSDARPCIGRLQRLFRKDKSDKTGQ